ncbi:sensor histidine kinase (plasmid) [Sphingobium sp. SJ10-10]|uniref:sensor histidine kinase n=1 Tax=Sphingobium sp. SJ10-10 TaxID=3114999 RepID=UPI003329E448
MQRAESIEDARSTIDERLAALGGAIEQLLTHDWEAAPLPALAENALAHFTLGAGRMRLAGPTVTIGPKAAMTLTLAFHELATNAIKYGALSNETGTIELTWKVLDSGAEAELWMQWAERGGPRVVKPERQGFGSRLICTAASRSLRGRAELDFPTPGIVWTLLAPLAAVEA